MAYHYPTDHSVRRWGTSMTIAAVVLGLYFVALFYFAVADGMSGVTSQPQETQILAQPN